MTAATPVFDFVPGVSTLVPDDPSCYQEPGLYFAPYCVLHQILGASATAK